jgi:ribonuclease HI
MRSKTKYYVVWKGRRTGIFSTWEECAAQVKGYPGAEYKGFSSRLQAEAARDGKLTGEKEKAQPILQQRALLDNPIPQEGWCVDAACSGRTGRLEYRGVDLHSGRQIFIQGPFEDGTNNVGEFLVIVHALQLLKLKRKPLAVYSDSSTARSWVRKKHCNTSLTANDRNAPLFSRIAQAEKWLAENNVHSPVLKWDTSAWGEIPADFNRK